MIAHGGGRKDHIASVFIGTVQFNTQVVAVDHRNLRFHRQLGRTDYNILVPIGEAETVERAGPLEFGGVESSGRAEKHFFCAVCSDGHPVQRKADPLGDGQVIGQGQFAHTGRGAKSKIPAFRIIHRQKHRSIFEGGCCVFNQILIRNLGKNTVFVGSGDHTELSVFIAHKLFAVL